MPRSTQPLLRSQETSSYEVRQSLRLHSHETCTPVIPTMAIQPEIAELFRSKKSQYCRYIDKKQWDKLAGLALPDATFSFFNPDGSLMRVRSTILSFSSPKAFVSNLKHNFADLRGVASRGAWRSDSGRRGRGICDMEHAGSNRAAECVGTGLDAWRRVLSRDPGA